MKSISPGVTVDGVGHAHAWGEGVCEKTGEVWCRLLQRRPSVPSSDGRALSQEKRSHHHVGNCKQLMTALGRLMMAAPQHVAKTTEEKPAHNQGTGQGNILRAPKRLSSPQNWHCLPGQARPRQAAPAPPATTASIMPPPCISGHQTQPSSAPTCPLPSCCCSPNRALPSFSHLQLGAHLF